MTTETITVPIQPTIATSSFGVVERQVSLSDITTIETLVTTTHTNTLSKTVWVQPTTLTTTVQATASAVITRTVSETSDSSLNPSQSSSSIPISSTSSTNTSTTVLTTTLTKLSATATPTDLESTEPPIDAFEHPSRLGVGLGIGFGVVLIFALGLLAGCWFRRHRRRCSITHHKEEDHESSSTSGESSKSNSWIRRLWAKLYQKKPPPEPAPQELDGFNKGGFEGGRRLSRRYPPPRRDEEQTTSNNNVSRNQSESLIGGRISQPQLAELDTGVGTWPRRSRGFHRFQQSNSSNGYFGHDKITSFEQDMEKTVSDSETVSPITPAHFYSFSTLSTPTLLASPVSPRGIGPGDKMGDECYMTCK